MTIVLSVVGSSGSGKTTLIEKLVPALKSKGLKVGVIKHATKGFEIDKEGKDSHRIFLSGADVAVLSKNRLALIRRVESDDLQFCLRYFEDYDVVLTEGFSRENFPKIIVMGEKQEKESGNEVNEKDIKTPSILATIKISGMNLDEEVEKIAKQIAALISKRDDARGVMDER